MRREAPKPLAEAPPDLLKEAHRRSARIAKEAAGNFYYAFILLPKSKRQGIEALYAFCRAGDDAADEPNAIDVQRDMIARLRDRLDLCFAGYYDDLMTLALTDSVHKFNFERKHFDDLLLGVESDLERSRFETLDDLWEYCYRVAATVGLLCLPIFGADTEQARAYAIELASGMQLTNILRDLEEDYQRGRIYLPERELSNANLTTESLFDDGKVSDRKRLVLQMATLARKRFDKARELLPAEHRDALIAARAMGQIYEAILDRIEADPTARKRVELNRSQKLGIARKLLVGQ